MSKGWSEPDKKIVKTALQRAQKRAAEQIVKNFKSVAVESIEDIWALEIKIREWRKDYGSFYFSYERVERLLGEFLKRGWTLEDDLRSLSEERFETITKNRKTKAN